ncbi:MAG: methyltransferase domain-containing protein [Clostridiales bacterium]|nr:methyltransferase domain-containing protein [Clostridiales bacterium]
MVKPQLNPGQYYKLVHQKRVTEIFLSGLRLHIFTELEGWETPASVAARTGLNERNVSLFLNALASIGMLEKDGTRFRNTPESNEFLNETSPLYLGECLLFRENMMSLHSIDEKVKNGPDIQTLHQNVGAEVYDFCEMARVTVPEMYTGRVQSLLAAVKELFIDRQPGKILDLGGGSGVFAMELVAAFPESKGVVFEHPKVTALPRRLITERGLSSRIEVMEGDFNKDGIGEDYDLIIASGVLDFAKDYLDSFLEKLKHALSANGYLYIVTHEVSEDYQNPPESILGWLSSHLDGLDLLLTKNTIEKALMKHGFHCMEKRDVGGMFKGLPGKFYQVIKEEEHQDD